ncbi:MAG: c-type cytochrome [Flavobacterium sp.]|uniref:c-type cytochrome n=1 Tax=Flavobacterium sp. TaxID=239 RepID=UPI002606D094|nr:c-type cytochrome [Flavobacterium sp.]MDD5152115.1 c-type cytochrome [Flavobacterium sp.]
MKTNVLIVAILLVLFTSCKNQKSSEDFGISATTSSTENSEALALFQQKCYACHSVITKSHSEIIAPPMIAVKKRYSMQYDNKEDFVNAVVAYASDPKVENALMPGAIDKFKPMPKQAFEEKDLRKIATYIYENQIETPVWFEDHFQQNHKNGQGMGMGMKNNK